MIQIPLARDDKYNSQCNGGSERVRARWPTSAGNGIVVCLAKDSKGAKVRTRSPFVCLGCFVGTFDRGSRRVERFFKKRKMLSGDEVYDSGHIPCVVVRPSGLLVLISPFI